MNKQFVRAMLVVTVALFAVSAMGQKSSSRSSGGGGGGGGHYSSGGSSSHSSGGSFGGSRGGSYQSGSSSGGGYSSGHYSGGSSYGGSSRYSGEGRYSSGTSRYSGGSTRQSSGGTREGGGRISSGASSSPYSRSNRGSMAGRTLLGTNGTFGRAQSGSRVGPTRYEGNNNHNTGSHVDPAFGRVSSSHVGLIRGGGIGGRVFGTERFRGGFHDGFRFGFYGYHSFWGASFWFFPFYCFDPFLTPCYCSPWYYYPCLPPYIAGTTIVVADSYPSENWVGRDYEYDSSPDRVRSSGVDKTVDNIVVAFQNDDHKAIEAVVPHSGKVNIMADGKYSYSLSSDDFYNTYIDGIESTKTVRYEVVSVKTNSDGTAKVIAKHIYNDPWGKEATVYHTYFLAREDGKYVIREFGTSNKL